MAVVGGVGSFWQVWLAYVLVPHPPIGAFFFWCAFFLHLTLPTLWHRIREDHKLQLERIVIIIDTDVAPLTARYQQFIPYAL